jgi:hypothetical protein
MLYGTGRDNLKMILKAKFEEYTESEFISLINRLIEGDYSSEREHDAIVDSIVNISEHPSGSDILYYPAKEVEDSPAGVLKAIKDWRAANDKPGFKPE